MSGYVSGWYDYPNGDVCLAFWKDGERCIERIPFEWYFYLTNDEFEKVRGSVYFRQLVERVKELDCHCRGGLRRPSHHGMPGSCGPDGYLRL